MASHALAFSGGDRSEGQSARFVAKSGVNRPVLGLSKPRRQAEMFRFVPPTQHRGQIAAYRRYLFLPTGLGRIRW